MNGVVSGKFPDCVSLCVVSNFLNTSIDAEVEVLRDIADDHFDPTLKSLSVSTDHKVLYICREETIVVDGHVDVPIPREFSHVDNNLAIVLYDCYNSLLTPADKISNMSDCFTIFIFILPFLSEHKF